MCMSTALSLHSPDNSGHEDHRPSRLLRSLWRLYFPEEPMVDELCNVASKSNDILWYQTADAFTGSIYYFRPDYFAEKQPIVVLLSPLLHPQITIHKKMPWMQTALSQGHAVYVITHRSHTMQAVQGQIEPVDTSISTIVQQDILTATDLIQQHSGCHSYHVVAQDLGSLLALQWLAMVDTRGFNSIHLVNPTLQVQTSVKRTVLSYLHQNKSVQQIWKRHLSTQTLPSAVKNLSLLERSVLWYSNGCLSKDWAALLRTENFIEALEISPNISLGNALPAHLDCPLHLYVSEPTDSTEQPTSPLYHATRYWDCQEHLISPAVFPLLDEAFRLHF